MSGAPNAREKSGLPDPAGVFERPGDQRGLSSQAPPAMETHSASDTIPGRTGATKIRERFGSVALET
jgi:hypothetical protein